MNPIDKVTAPSLETMKRRQERIVALTAYDYPSAAILDAAGVEVVLVGDSLANVVLGYESTVPVTLEEMLVSLRAVRRGLRRALLVADLPFGYGHGGSSSRASEAAIAFLKAGAEAVKLEGGRSRVELVRALVDAAVPVMGHIGLTPQSVHSMGGYKVQGKTAESAAALLDDALALEAAGAFALVLEGVPEEVGSRISAALRIPTIGIGAGPGCDGQILVLHDFLGLTVAPPSTLSQGLEARKPRFVRQYLDLRRSIFEAVGRYADDVKSGRFPSAAESYRLSEAETARTGR